jgi:Tfp pilus assembly protein PilF
VKQEHEFIFFSRAAILCLAVILSLAGCSLPKIIVLHDPLSPEEHNNLGRIYESQTKFDQAVQQYHAALKKDPNFVPSLLLLGDLSYRLKKYSEAESAYKKAIKLQPENGNIYNNLCWVYIDQKINLETAAELIQKALSLTPEHHRPYYLDTLGVILLRSGKTAESIAALKHAVELLPKDVPAYLAEAYTHLAEAYTAAGNMIEAHEAEQAAEKYRITQ